MAYDPKNKDRAFEIEKKLRQNRREVLDKELATLEAEYEQGLNEQKDRERRAEANILWQEFKEQAKQLKAEGLRGYDTPLASLMQVAKLAVALSEAISASMPFKSPLAIICDMFSELLAWPFKKLYKKVRRDKPVPEVELEPYEFKLPFDDDGKIVRGKDNFTSKTSDSPSNEEVELFEMGTCCWLYENGYDLNENDQIVEVDAPDAVISKDNLENLRDNPENGIAHYFENEFNIRMIPKAPDQAPAIGLGNN